MICFEKSEEAGGRYGETDIELGKARIRLLPVMVVLLLRKYYCIVCWIYLMQDCFYNSIRYGVCKYFYK